MKQGGSSTATVLSESGNGAGLAVLEAPPHKEEVDAKLDQAREQLLTLRRQQEELERQKSDLEELRRKQDEYARGKAEMIDNLTRSLVTLEREQIQAQRLAESCETTTGAFRDYLDQLHAINDEEWSSATVRTELSRALGTIENARCEFNRARTKLDCLNPAAGQPATPATTEPAGMDWPEILRYARLGAAASAPLIVAGTIWVILLLTIKH
jgi:DNA repair exonuclease SbcCD ATPase subunit